MAKLFRVLVWGFRDQDAGLQRGGAERSEACIATRIAFTVWIRCTLDNISVNKK